MNEEEDDAPTVVNFFSRRAKLVPKVSAEEFEATSRLLEEIWEGKERSSSAEKVEFLPVKKSRRKAFAKEKCVEPVKIALDDDVENTSSNSEAPLSAAAKRRLRKLQKEHDKELKTIEAANKEVLSALNTSISNEAEEVDVENVDKIITLTISYFSNVSRIKCGVEERFSTIFPKVADLLKLKVSEFLLCLKETNIKVDDTPKDLNIAHTDILECIPYKGGENSETEYEENKLKLYFQSDDSKEKTEIIIHKLVKLQEAMEKYSKTRNIPLNQLIFEFDGEKISGSETPEDMDMESENCIDVRVLATYKKRPEKPPRKRNNKPLEAVESGSNDLDIIWCD